ncbi:MAG TPA: lysylphosphatidylglycerol synthase transmembrane domain-containing protein [Candidatus Binatia bacterium]|nr:lysylphosphatidylglycerol synthase transmembrane domain-containing protein [Candidatus Binatia bacterium]
MTRAHRLRILAQAAVTIGILVALIMILNPGQLGQDIERFPVILVPAALGLTVCFYLTKGLRYYQLLRSEGVPVTPRSAVLFTVGGEAFGLLPFGELARAELVTEATSAPLGTSIAAVTVQELLYTTVIVAVAIPGALAYAAGISGIALSLFGILAIIGILTVGPVFRAVLGAVRRVPVIRRASIQLEVLHEQTVRLLRRPETWVWLTLSVLGALFELTLFWLMVWGASGTPLPWVTTTFIYGAAYLAGAASSPGGGVGGFESTVIALLHTQGVLGPAAVAAALLQRAADKGVITTAGFCVFFWVRRHIRRRRGLLLGDGETAIKVPATTRRRRLIPVAVPIHVEAALLPRPVAGLTSRRAVEVSRSP